MSGTVNFLYGAGKALIVALDKHEREHDPAKLLEGPESEVAERWACSAVKLKDNAGWLVVPRADPVKFEGGRRVRAFDGGKYGGRSKYYAMEWLQSNAEAVALGALTLADGGGAHSVFPGGLVGADSTVRGRDDSTDGKYYVEVWELV